MKPPVGVSSCLLGRRVRYDGGRKKDDAVRSLAEKVRLVPVCPEMELGLGRAAGAHPAGAIGPGIRLKAPGTGRDLTGAMARFARARAEDLLAGGLCGFILKKDSPSCGAEGVKVHSTNGSKRSGQGFFARALMEADPSLPLVEEDDLKDVRGRKVFLERVIARHRLRTAGSPPKAAARRTRPSA